MSLAPGVRLGPYEILSPLGSGGMGDVYRARDTRLDRIVAIKVLAAELANDPQFRDRFDREARTISQLDHPHICALYDVGEQNPSTHSASSGQAGSGQPVAYLVMQYLEGETLETRLKKGALPLDQALQYAIQIADALDKAHRAGIVHRDLKPGNIMLIKAGATLLDFGLAKATGPVGARAGLSMLPTTPPGLTAQGTILGTFQYMAPEQLEGKDADARTDIFAFGAVVYEMVTGKKAFEGKSHASLIGAILKDEPPSISQVQPLAPPLLDRVVKKCLAKDPEARWQTAHDLHDELTWIAEAPSQAALATDGQPHRRRWRLAAAALIIGLVGGWFVGQIRQPPIDERVIRFHVEPPAGGQVVFGTNTGGIALSPDGKSAAYVAWVGGKNAVWIRSLDGTAAHMLQGTEGAGYPFWSPDSRSIAFIAGTKLQRVDAAGGSPLPICDIGASFRGGAWSSEGFILFGTVSSGLFRVPASGGTPSPLTTLDAASSEGYHGFPQVLPGNRFLYWVRGGKPDSTGIYASSPASPRDRVLLMTTEANALYAPGGDGRDYLLWTRGGTLLGQEFDAAALKLVGEPHPVADPVGTAGVTGLMNATASANGVLLFSGSNVVSQLTWLDRTGKGLGTVGDLGEYNTFRLSPEGRRVIASRERPGGADVWLLDVDRSGIATRMTSRLGNSVYPIWSPDGEAVVFGYGNPSNLFRQQISRGAGSEHRLTQSPNLQQPMDWSRDGRWILVYDLTTGTGRDLAVLATGSPDAKPESYLRTPFSEWWGRFSPEPNPRWVAYQSDESGRTEVYIDTFPTAHGRTRISTGGGQFPAWGAGGRELFYVSPDFKLMAVNLTLEPESVRPSSPRELFPLPAVDTGRSPYDVAPDGQRFLVRATPKAQASEPLTTIVNWPALLKR